MPWGRARCIKDAAAEIDFTCVPKSACAQMCVRERARPRTGANLNSKPRNLNPKPRNLNPKLSKHARNTRP